MRKIVSLMVALLCLTATAQTVTLTATKYHPGVGGVGHHTADGSYIDKKKLANGEIRWVAFSLDMFSQYGYRLGDTIVVRCDKVPEVNGEWVVRDKMGGHLRKRMDFLLPHRGSNYFHGHVTVEVSKKKASKKGAAAAGDVANPTAATSKVRSVTELSKWEFSRDSAQWRSVTVPHDWAIDGPFDKKWDLQMVAIKENGEDVATEHSGRSGALPWIGRGYYRTTFAVPQGNKHAELRFDGAMADAHVYVNGHLAGGWPYGYNAFVVDASPYIHSDGTPNTVAVSLENLEESNRWYPGGGIYRTVKLVTTPQALHLDPWNLQVVTRFGAGGHTLVDVAQAMPGDANLDGCTLVMELAGQRHELKPDKRAFSHTFDFAKVDLWSPEHPALHNLRVQLLKNGKLVDEYTQRVGLRTLAWGKEVGGFTINGKPVKFKGVCLHHDLGPIGAAENRTAMLRQLTTMMDMGANAIRTSHNMPSTMMMELCDSLGLLVMAESFDAWHDAKVRNGYNRLWNDWWQRDITNLVLNHRNHPCVVMWSVGNEIPEQWKPEGAQRYKGLRDLCHILDPTRPVTCGMDNPDADLESGFAQVADVPGFNYRVHKYPSNLERLPQGFLLGSETASTVSSRGIYMFPDTCATGKAWPSGQCSSYDTEYCWWSNLPDDDWAMHEQLGDKCIGEFVWTGYDYLGEPTPYDSYWPSRSSYFGICDLAGLPKDRYWLYRSHWNTTSHTLHVLPHWTWPGREGEVTPVYCYTDYPSAELWVNGRSQGRLTKDASSRLDRYRLRWRDVRYEPGEIKVVAYDEQGRAAAEQVVRTAGEPARIALETDHYTLHADGRDLAYITVSLVDSKGTMCPTATDRIAIEVSGAGKFRAMCNGDATSIESFTLPSMSLFSGQLVVVVQAGDKPGPITVTARCGARNLEKTLTINAR